MSSLSPFRKTLIASLTLVNTYFKQNEEYILKDNKKNHKEIKNWLKKVYAGFKSNDISLNDINAVIDELAELLKDKSSEDGGLYLNSFYSGMYAFKRVMDRYSIHKKDGMKYVLYNSLSIKDRKLYNTFRIYRVYVDMSIQEFEQSKNKRADIHNKRNFNVWRDTLVLANNVFNLFYNKPFATKSSFMKHYLDSTQQDYWV